MAHITGGGLEENLTRAVPHPLSVTQRDAWEMPKLLKDSKTWKYFLK